MKTELVVSTIVEGLHFWPDPPEQFSEFSILHRHLFRFILHLPVDSKGGPERRPVELWELRRKLVLWVRSTAIVLPDGTYNFTSRSCEGLATELLERSGASRVFVGEDDNLGAEVSL